MNKAISSELVAEVVQAYLGSARVESCKSNQVGHINDTLEICVSPNQTGYQHFIFQRINQEVFTKPLELMENIVGVTRFLRQKIREKGGDPDRESLNVVPTLAGQDYYLDSQGEFWRVYLFIEDSLCLQQAETSEDLYQSGLVFGNFQNLLATYPAESLHETIPHFHDTWKRLNDFKQVLAQDPLGRAKTCQAEIDFVLEHAEIARYMKEILGQQVLPLRVTHNDTKLNNILFDQKTRQAICVIDLDTIMPGLAINDYGDTIRFGASSALEDEQDLSLVQVSLWLFSAYTKGFLEGSAGQLSQAEIDHLPFGAKAMTYECGMRFLTDYLEGDRYFRIARPSHNLDRARTQFKLVADMEAKDAQMREIVGKFADQYA
ncbi:MAG: phosphotransferase [Eubacteriales bacterium]|nr:phosphotransferase [Clostridiales bacterium]MDY5836474.1 phosphotransferase [Eubacteriales bacterium]